MDRHLSPLSRRVFARASSLALLFGLTAAVSFLGIASRRAVGADGDLEIIESKGSFESQGKTIGIDRFEPKAPGKYPAVLIVHGATGLALGGPWFRDSALLLARRGYVAHVVHYFDLTDTKVANIPTMRKHFPVWMRALADGVSNARRQPNVDEDRVGLLGFSLGSYLSLSLAMYDYRVLAIVENFGGLPDVLIPDVKTLPPTLILHGDADLVVPVAEAKVLEELYQKKKIHHEICIYPGQGHGFVGETGVDAGRRMLAFFEVHLKAAQIGSTRRETAAVPDVNLFAEAMQKVGRAK